MNWSFPVHIGSFASRKTLNHGLETKIATEIQSPKPEIRNPYSASDDRPLAGNGDFPILELFFRSNILAQCWLCPTAP